MSHDSPFLRRIVKVAVEITWPAVEQFCDGLERLPTGFGQAELAALVDSFAQPELRAALSSLLSEWRQQGRDATPRELAWALRAASSTDELHRLCQRLEMVWSGPLSGASTFRRTDQALLELIQTAKWSIMVVAFAAYKIPEIATALVDAAKRGVRISLILESTEESDGAVTFNALNAMGAELAGAATVYAWPMEKRGSDAKGNRGALHAKCAVVDEEAALISSANLTEHAMNLNMELGILVRGGEIPRSLGGHLRSLIQSRVLVDCSRADQNRYKQP
jgi:phosphatidylserine/phosphatidylglycerophosphate/cardiolipin synthase-like enzyme